MRVLIINSSIFLVLNPTILLWHTK